MGSDDLTVGNTFNANLVNANTVNAISILGNTGNITTINITTGNVVNLNSNTATITTLLSTTANVTTINANLVNATTFNSNNINSNVSITTNTGLTLGTSSIGANGYSFLPNGLVLQWGHANANSTQRTVTFPVGYGTNCYSVTAVGNTTGTDNSAAVNIIAVYGINSTAFLLKTGNASNVPCSWMAIGN